MIDTLVEFLFGCYLNRIDQWFWAAVIMLPPVGLIAKQKSLGPAAMVMMVGTLIFRSVLPAGPFDFFVWLVVTAFITWVGYKIFIDSRGP